jgi:antitoxin component YwqK of YwqJK toxin-antitoxin module
MRFTHCLTHLLLAGWMTCLFQFQTSAQDFDRSAQINSTKNSLNFIVQGVLAHKDKDYDKAVESYSKVHLNDTNYELSLYQKGLALMAAEQYEDAIVANESGMRLKGDLYHSFIGNLGTCYSHLEEYENAEEVYLEGLQMYPYSSYLKFNRASALLKGGDEDGFEVLYECIRSNPFHPKSHLLLGGICAEQGLHSQAAMAYYFFLIMEGSSNRAAQALSNMEDYFSNDLEVDETYFEDLPSLEEGFGELDESVDEKVALNRRFRVPTKLSLATMRQVYYVISNLDEVEDEEGFFHDFYIPFFEKLMEDNQFEGSSYHSAQSFIPYSSSVAKAVRSGSGDADRFRRWFADAFNELYQEHEVEVDGETVKMKFHYADKALLGMGDLNDDDKVDGDWVFFHKNGMKSSEGRFDDGEKTGDWIYYSRNGKPASEFRYDDDVKDGPFKVYWSKSGNLYKEGRYRDGKLQGEVRTYYPGGGLNEIEHYSEGKLDGNYKKHYKNGAVEYDIEFEDGLFSGSYKAYYENGKIYQKRTYDAGELTGDFINYYNNGQVSSTVEYANNERNGEFKEYDKEGNLTSEGNYVDDVMVGENVLYHSNGKIKIKATFDDKGRETGQYEEFDEEGNLTDLHVYKKGRLRSYQFFNQKGRVISEGEKKGKYVIYKSVRPNRTKVSEGRYRKGEKDGSWKYYNSANVLKSKLNYYRGTQTGDQKWFYANGDLSEVTKMEDGEYDGLSESYYSGGNISTRGYYRNGRRVGEWYSFNSLGNMVRKNYYYSGRLDGWQVYYTEQGKIDYKSYYDVGDLKGSVVYDSLEAAVDTIWLNEGTGTYVRLRYNGDTAFVGHYENGQANGDFTWYYSGNIVSSTGQYVNGERHGDWNYYTRSGDIWLERKYENGNRVGDYKRYWSGTDQLSYTESYKYGKVDGMTQSFYANGQVRSSSEYKDGSLEGETRFYDFAGNLALVLNYKEGLVMSYSYLDESGELVEPIEVGKGAVDIEAFYKNGKPSIQYSVDNQWVQGEYLFLTAEGDTIRYSENEDHDLEGVVKEFHENGQLRYMETYQKDEEHGTCYYYHDNGQVRKIARYYNGDLFGPISYFDKDGQHTKTVYYHNDEEVWRKEN